MTVTIHEIERGAGSIDAAPDRGIHPLSEEQLTMDGVDRHLMALSGASLAARCSCWWTRVPERLDERIGVIGHYAAADHAAGGAVIGRAARVLASAGCTLAVGPMDGNTWRRYRFITERGEAPPFFLEPDNPDEWPSHWTAAGFTPLATYSSAANEDLSTEDPRTERSRESLLAAGIRLRELNPSDAEADLQRIFTLSLLAFSGNFLYTPIDEREFMAANRALLPHVRPELVLMAERAGDLVGYMFAVPDMLQARRGEPVDTVILKTMAVHPAVRGAGLGGVLMDDVQRAARTLGFRRAIHALMHEGNRSRRLSDRYARTIRRYTLFSCPLASP
jgi:GNAT superfamily N-acetyltransferase